MIVQLVKFNTSLPHHEVQRTIEEREERYRALPGLLQKLYVRDEQTDRYGGIYVWANHSSLRDFLDSELAQTIPVAYGVDGPPVVEDFEVMSVLRTDSGTLLLG